MHPVIIFGHVADDRAPKRVCVCDRVMMLTKVLYVTHPLKLYEGSGLHMCELQKRFPAFVGTNSDTSPENQRRVWTAYV